MEFDNATNLDRKSGGPPTIALVAEVSAVAPFWESNGNRSSSSQVPSASLRSGFGDGREYPG